jgi:Ca2+-binding EF-hand superfamily protein
MGQAFGVPLAHADIRPFTNLPKEALQSIWTSYNLLGEGWGLELPDFKAIFLNAPHLMSMGFTDAQLEALFIALDTDNNGLVDALESLAVLALVSGMESMEKLQFIYSAYDFNSADSLSSDETVLLLRSVIKGLAKVCPDQGTRLLKLDNMEKALNEAVEGYVGHIFANGTPTGAAGISSKVLQSYASSHPVMHSWLTFCASFPFSAAEAAAQVTAVGTSNNFNKGMESAVESLYKTLPISHTLA